jgi:hypothetical protein
MTRMSSSVSLTFPQPITLFDWVAFCDEMNLSESTNGCWYQGDVEISVGPPYPTNHIDVSTYWMGDLEAVAQVAGQIMQRFHGKMKECSPELTELMAEYTQGLIEVHPTLFFTPKELQALQELGKRLALEGEFIGSSLCEHIDMDLAINFIVGANLWSARAATGFTEETK